MADVKLYNTLTRQKEVLKPIQKGKVGLYACGPTVYNYAHLGNLRAYVFMDTLRRMLEYTGNDVNLVVNITDVGHLTDDADQGEDKMEKGAAREGKTVWDVANFYTQAFMEDITKLNIKQPSVWCKATDHIKEQEELTQQILDNGLAYVTADGIYFDTKKLPTYGKMIPNFDPQKLAAGKRVDLGDKRSPTDFALWKFSPESQQRAMEWESTFTLEVSDDEEKRLQEIATASGNITLS